MDISKLKIEFRDFNVVIAQLKRLKNYAIKKFNLAAWLVPHKWNYQYYQNQG